MYSLISHQELSDEDRADILEVLDTYEGTPVSPEDDAVVQNIVRDIIREYDLDKEGTISRINFAEFYC